MVILPYKNKFIFPRFIFLTGSPLLSQNPPENNKLSEADRAKIAAHYSSLFADILNNRVSSKFSLEELNAEHYFLINNAPLPDSIRQIWLNDGNITSEILECINIFFTTLISFLNSQNAQNKEKLGVFLKKEIFNGSDTIFNDLLPADQLYFGAILTAISEIQANLGHHFINSLVYDFRLYDLAKIEQLCLKIQSFNLAEKLDLINLLQTISAQVLSQSWAEVGYPKIKILLDQLSQNAPLFLQYALKIAYERLALEEINPSGGIVIKGIRSDSRVAENLDESLQEENRTISRKISLDSYDHVYSLSRIAKDYIGILDHSNTPQQIAKVDLDSLQSQSKVQDLVRFMQIQVFLTESQLISLKDAKAVVEYLLSELLPDLNENKFLLIAKSLHQIFPLIPEKTWQDILQSRTAVLKHKNSINYQIAYLNCDYEKKLRELFVELALQQYQALPKKLLQKIDQKTLAVINSPQNHSPEELFNCCYAFMEIVGRINRLAFEKERLSVDTASLAEPINNNRTNLILDFHSAKGPFAILKEDLEKDLDLLTLSIDPSTKASTEFYDQIVQNAAKSILTDEQPLNAYLKTVADQESAKTKLVTPHSYQQVLAEISFLSPQTLEDENTALLLQRLHNPQMRQMIEADLGIKFAEINLRSQIQLLRYLSSQDRSTFLHLKAALQAKPNLKQEVFSTFLACASHQNYGDLILKLLETPGTEAIFQKFHQIIEIIDQKAALIAAKTNHSIAANKFDTVVFRRAIELIEQVSQTDPAKLAAKIDQIEHFHQEVVIWGALFNSAQESLKDQADSSLQLNEVFKDVEVQIFSGGNLITSDGQEQMNNPANYLCPEKFALKDYQTFVANLNRTYSKLDPGWLQYLIPNIPRDLNNTQVNFVLIRNKINQELIGLMKYKPDPADPAKYYAGSMYVNPEYQKNFGVGEYLWETVAKFIPGKSEYWGSVAILNPALERHIEIGEGVADEVITEGDQKSSSGPLYKVNIRNPHYFETKNKQLFTKAAIVSLAKDAALNPAISSSNEFVVLEQSLTANQNPSPESVAKKYFSQGFFLTRYFLVKASQQGQTDQAYLVFEKPTSLIKKSE